MNNFSLHFLIIRNWSKIKHVAKNYVHFTETQEKDLQAEYCWILLLG